MVPQPSLLKGILPVKIHALFFPSLFSLAFAVLSLLHFGSQQTFSASPSKWTRMAPSNHFSSSFRSVKQCHLVAMVIASEEDHRDGVLEAWFNTLPARQTNRVCCVSVRRSSTTSFEFHPSSTSCDSLMVPMIREDTYLTISEKVHLGFFHISSLYDFKWLLKADADSFVCFTRMLNLLQNYDSEGITYLGYSESRNILIENPEHIWYDPSMTDIVHNSRQPVVSGTGMYHPYMQGAGYILSKGALRIISSALPSLRYSPIEDAMVGSWLLAYNAHWGVLDLDLRAEVEGCRIKDHLYISHYRKGAVALSGCRDANKNCTNMSEVRTSSVREVSFLVTTHLELHRNELLDLYESIRAIFPTNEIIIGDNSASDVILNRFLMRADDRKLRGYSFPKSRIVNVKNSLVELASTKYVCLLQDVQRLSWETMIGVMLHPVETDEVDVTSGFLVFNPNMMNSSERLFQYGYSYKDKSGWRRMEAVQANMTSPADSYEVHGTTGFILARKTFLIANRWHEFGPFSEEAFHWNLHRTKARIRLVNSGVRHGYHYPLNEMSADNKKFGDEIRKYVRKMCNLMAEDPETPQNLRSLNDTLMCEKGVFKRKLSNDNSTDAQLYISWS